MARSPFLLFTLGVLSSVPSSVGFSTSRLLSARSPGESQRRSFKRGIVLLHVATDPSTITSQTDEDGGRSYDFISVEEAEAALQRERVRYEEERSDLQWLLEVQRQQLQDLAEGRPVKEKIVDRNRGRRGTTSPSRIVILGGHGPSFNNGKKYRKKGTGGNSRNNSNGNDRNNTKRNDESYHRMEQLENLLQDAIIQNENLTRRLREQQRQYSMERSAYEGELQEERGRLNGIRDELHMERAYFETSRRMLEHLLQEEQQKVRELENELMAISREHAFSQEQQSQEEYQELERRQNSQNHHVQDLYTQNQMNNENRNQQEKRGRGRASPGFTMNINDVQQPLYP